MTLPTEELRARAKRAHAKLQRARRQPRYQRVMGRFVGEGLLETNDSRIAAHKEPVALEDVLWAGRFEPRLLELLPAVVVKRPGMLEQPMELPEDLREAANALRAGYDYPDFRGIPGADYGRWAKHVGRKGHPSQLKSFRLRRDDLERLRRLKDHLHARSETDVLRIAMRVLERTIQDAPDEC